MILNGNDVNTEGGYKYTPPTYSLDERGVHELKLNCQFDGKK